MNATDVLGLAEGEQRRDEAFALLADQRAVYVLRGRRALMRALLENETASADDVRALVDLPPSIDPRCLGSVPVALVRAGIIRAAGFVRSGRPERHASWLQLWELADRAGALKWLAENPDVPDPPDVAGDGARVQGVLVPLTTNEPAPAGMTAGAGR